MKIPVFLVCAALTLTSCSVLNSGAGGSRTPDNTPRSSALDINSEFAEIVLTTDADQSTGVPRDSAALPVGESITIYARGMSANGKWLTLPPYVAVRWKADAELAIIDTTGQSARVRVEKQIRAAAFVNATYRGESGKTKSKDFLFKPRN